MLHIQQNSIRYMGNKLPLEEEFSSSNEFPTAKHRCSKNTPWFRCGETILHMINLNYYFRTTAYFLLLNYPFALHLLTPVYSLWNAAFVCQRHRPPRWQSVLWDRERDTGKESGSAQLPEPAPVIHSPSMAESSDTTRMKCKSIPLFRYLNLQISVFSLWY